MGRVKFVHGESGLERVIKVGPNDLLRTNGLSYYSFQSSIPHRLFPDVGEQVPGMPVAEWKVRCCRKHHRIILWPNGRLTLAAHQGKRARQAMKVAQAMGQKYRCVEILETYRNVCKGKTWVNEYRKILPKGLSDIAEAAYHMASPRYRNRNTESFVRLKERTRARKDKLLRAKLNEVTGTDKLWDSPMKDKIGGGWVRFRESEDPWFKRVFLSGMLKSELCLDGERFFPTLVPDHVIRTGFGYIGCLNSEGKPYWVMVDRVGEKYLDSRTAKKPTWIVNSFYPVDSGSW